MSTQDLIISTVFVIFALDIVCPRAWQFVTWLRGDFEEEDEPPHSA